MNPFPRDGFNWVNNFQSRKIGGDFLSQKEFHILFLASWETFEAHGASWSVHHQQTPLLLGVELVDIEMVARPPQVSGCLLLVGWKISVFIYKKGCLACSTEVKQKFDTTVESVCVCVYLCTMWAAHIGNYIDLLMNIMNILDFIAMFWNWKRDRHMALRLNLGLKGQSLNWNHVGSYIYSLSCWLVSNAEHTCEDQSAEGEAHPQGRINSISSLCIICACSVSESVEICSGNWLLSEFCLNERENKMLSIFYVWSPHWGRWCLHWEYPLLLRRLQF